MPDDREDVPAPKRAQVLDSDGVLLGQPLGDQRAVAGFGVALDTERCSRPWRGSRPCTSVHGGDDGLGAFAVQEVTCAANRGGGDEVGELIVVDVSGGTAGLLWHGGGAFSR